MTTAATPLLTGAWLDPWFSVWGAPVTPLEVLAFVLSIAMVLGNVRVRVWAWPLAIAASACYAVLFAASRLYGEASLQLFFIAVSAWGWWQWLRARDAQGQPLEVRVMTPRQRLQTAALTLAAWPLLGLLLARATDTDVPYADALPTVGSIAGQILLGRKLVENWPVWLVVNVVSVGLFAWKGLWLTVLLYAIFAVLSWFGWQAWRHRLLAGGHG